MASGMASCPVKGCSGMVMPLAAMPPCPYCGKAFCIPHRIPEVHGCAGEARMQAQMANTVAANEKREQVRRIGTEDARKNLHKRLDELAEMRKKKKKK